MKAKELRQKDSFSLQATLQDLYNKQFRLKMRLGTAQLKANHLLKEVRRDIARVKTLMSETRGAIDE